MLLRAGAKPTAQDAEGRLPYDRGLEKQQWSVTQLLAAEGGGRLDCPATAGKHKDATVSRTRAHAGVIVARPSTASRLSGCVCRGPLGRDMWTAKLSRARLLASSVWRLSVCYIVVRPTCCLLAVAVADRPRSFSKRKRALWRSSTSRGV
eukprot:7378004-Prymnesium_polylepis.1